MTDYSPLWWAAASDDVGMPGGRRQQTIAIARCQDRDRRVVHLEVLRNGLEVTDPLARAGEGNLGQFECLADVPGAQSQVQPTVAEQIQSTASRAGSAGE